MAAPRTTTGRTSSRSRLVWVGLLAAACADEPPPAREGDAEREGALAVEAQVPEAIHVPSGAHLLHVVAAESGQAIDDFDLYLAGFDRGGAWPQHPGAGPDRLALHYRASSPLAVERSTDRRWDVRFFWVHTNGRAWSLVQLDHAESGEHTVALERAGDLVVELEGAERWFEPVVRIWGSDATKETEVPFAERAPDARDRAAFYDLPPDRYTVSVERGREDYRTSFGRASAEVVVGESTVSTIALDLPPPPVEERVAGRLTLPEAWGRAAELGIRARGEARLWAEGPVEVPVGRMRPVAGSPGLFDWEATVPVHGSYEIACNPARVHRVIDVPAGGADDVELVVPPPADLEVRVVDERDGSEVPVRELVWLPDGWTQGGVVVGTRIPPNEAGRFTFRVPAGPLFLRSGDPSWSLIGGSDLRVEAGETALELVAKGQGRAR